MIYLDTSAATKLLGCEPERGSMHATLHGAERVGSSVLLRIEMHRLTRNGPTEPTREQLGAVENMLGGTALVSIDASVVETACRLPGHIKSLDAIHLATALALNSGKDPVTMLTYDKELAEASIDNGLRCASPGATV